MNKAKLLSELSHASLILAVGAGLPYTFGQAADVLPVQVKKYVTIGAAVCAGSLKTIQYAIQLVSWWTGDSGAQIPAPAMSPLSPTLPTSKL